MRGSRIVLLVALVLASACTAAPALVSPSPTLTATSTTQPTATALATPTDPNADLIAVAKRIFPFQSQFNYYVVCGLTGDTSGCPMTDRLRALLARKQTTLCRCQNPADALTLTAAATSTGGVAHVVYGSNPNLALRFDLIIVRESGQLLVDDEECTGRGPSSSIYVSDQVCAP